ncbi:MAG: endonuclease MutS2 [Bacillaceae bacterium]|nr:endonuclease MutS2 [Bacillaceae bacterium]
MEDRVLKILEFDKILKQLSEHASSTMGKEQVMQTRPASDIEQARIWQEETREGTIVLRLKGQVPLGGIRDIRSAVKRAAIGSMLGPGELLDIGSTLHAGERLKKFIVSLVEEEESLPHLQRLSEQIVPLKQLQQAISRCIDEHGDILDHASPELQGIRRQIRDLESRVREKLEQFTRSSSHQKMLQENIVTIRNDRYVIPIKPEYRHVFGGIVHDQSASGATLFVEPEAVVQLNNRLREARAREEREIERILTELSGHVAEKVADIEQNIEALAAMDVLFARAFYAQKIRATEPRLNENGYVRFKKARHPLIAGQDVVPIDVELGDDYQAIVITGPNTGGKTVSLKTIGLLSLMAMSGLHIPVEEGSDAAVFSSVFADIGDEQSIEQNLSTFSSHLTHIIHILKHMDQRSLVLFDELGAGTDPAEGAALAIAILDHVLASGARLVATTHYSELKAYAYNRKGVINASVEFDVETLRPTYRLLIGVPGRSNAFAIAQRLGLEPAIIETARAQISTDENRVETMIASLEQSRRKAEEEEEKMSTLRREVEVLRQELEREREQLNRQREDYLKKARQEAEQMVEKARSEAERIIADLRRMAQEEQAGIKEHKLIEAKKGLEEALPDSSPSYRTQAKVSSGAREKIQPGDEVKVLSLGQKGQVLADLGNGEYQVQIGIIKTNVAGADLQRLKQPKAEQTAGVTRIKQRRQHVKMELDLRGYKVEDAINEIDKYLDDAILAGLNQVSLIHGKGTGQLRKGVHDYLRNHRHVKSFRLGGQGEGGLGATIVELK